MGEGEGKKIWFIPDGYMSSISNGKHYVSHEAVCVLNTGSEDANIKLTFYFEDREPMDKFAAVCKAQRTNHIRLDKIEDEDGNKVPLGVPYAIRIQSDCNIIVQHSRLDTTQCEMSLMTTIAY
ncbi:MAG: sensory rhodopsin transducer [Clostridia bacterium]|nr:sensory rhodopsin transducer [Clostridia bacterium]